jgi:hypothetical protein
MLSSLYRPTTSANVPSRGKGRGRGRRLCRRCPKEKVLTSASICTSLALLLSAASASDIVVGYYRSLGDAVWRQKKSNNKIISSLWVAI